MQVRTPGTVTAAGAAASARRACAPLFCAAVLLATLGGCGGEKAAPAGGADAAGPVPGGTAVVALSSDPDGLNPLVYTSATAGMVFGEMHDGLTELGADLDWTPRIARSWDVAEDGRAVTYHLAPARWSDGAPLTAADVVTSFDLFVDPRTASPRRGLYRDVLRAVAVDDSTVRYDLARPLPDPLQRTWHHLLPAHVVRGLDPAQAGTWPIAERPVVAGEFVVEEWSHNRSLTLVRNPYFRGRPALLDRVVFRVIPDEAARLVALETGEVDLVDGLPPAAARRLAERGDVRVSAVGGRRFYYLQWNFARGVFAEAAVRRALSLALDRPRMVDALVQGFGRPASGPIPPALWNHHRDLAAPACDPAAARALLEAAGWRDEDGDGVRERAGVRLEFEILTRQGDPVREGGAAIIRDNLAGVGVAVRLRVMEHVAGLARLRAGDFDAYFGLLNANLYGDPSGYVHSTATDQFNNGGYANARVDSLLDLALGMTDRAASLPVWLQVQEVLAEDPPAAYLFYPDNLVGVSLRLQEVQPHLLSPINNLADWWIRPEDRRYLTR
jgi:peptide/nickel transport system substrate-binding protein